MGPAVIPLNEMDLPEGLKWCNWLPVFPAMNTLGQAISEGSTHPQEESKVGWTWCHPGSKGCGWWVALKLHHDEEHYGLERLVSKPGFCVTKNLISTGLQAPCKRKRWNPGLVKMFLLSGMDPFCASWWSCSKLRSLMHNADFDLMVHAPFSRLACVLSSKSYIFSHIRVVHRVYVIMQSRTLYMKKIWHRCNF